MRVTDAHLKAIHERADAALDDGKQFRRDLVENVVREVADYAAALPEPDGLDRGMVLQQLRDIQEEADSAFHNASKTSDAIVGLFTESVNIPASAGTTRQHASQTKQLVDALIGDLFADKTEPLFADHADEEPATRPLLPDYSQVVLEPDNPATDRCSHWDVIFHLTDAEADIVLRLNDKPYDQCGGRITSWEAVADDRRFQLTLYEGGTMTFSQGGSSIAFWVSHRDTFLRFGDRKYHARIHRPA